MTVATSRGSMATVGLGNLSISINGYFLFNINTARSVVFVGNHSVIYLLYI